MSTLPKKWVLAPIGSLCILRNGRAFKPSEWAKEGLPIVRIQNLNNTSAQFNYYNGAADDRHRLYGGELLFAWSGTPGTSFGAHVWRGGAALLNQHIFRVDFNESFIDRRFFRYGINQKLTELIAVAHGAAGLQHVTKGVFEATNIVLPPRAEQVRIASKLDAVLNRVDSVNARLIGITFLLKRFRQSVLAAATSGRLTEGWRKEKKIDDCWISIALAEAASDFSYGSSEKSSKIGKTPVLRMGNIQDGRLDWIDLVYTSNEFEISKYSLQKGDVLFNRTNSPELVGKSAVYKGEREAVYAGYLIRIRCSDRLLPDFLNFSINGPLGREYCRTVKSDGVSQSNINAKKIAAFRFNLPSVAEQIEIVTRVEILLAFADRLEARLQTAQASAARLTPSLLAKAFRGELVPQDPDDEPAAELLKRLAEARPASKVAKKERGPASTMV